MKSDWVIIQSFERVHQAELRRDILEKNEIKSVIVNAQDSLFLTGTIDLYVSPENEKKAKALIDEFEGLTKINSFIDIKPILQFQNILSENGIDSLLKKKEDSRYIIDNFELYVQNEDLEKVIPFLTGEKLQGWDILDKYKKVRQTLYRINLLAEKLIESIIIKKRDSEHHLEEIIVYVKTEELQAGRAILEQLNGWITVKTIDNYTDAEIFEEILEEREINALIRRQNGNFEICVEAHNEEIAIDIINTNNEWVEAVVTESLVEAVYFKDILVQNNVPAVIINEQDTTFLYGRIEIRVEKTNLVKALAIINENKSLEE